jgi:hypothetical protein
VAEQSVRVCQSIVEHRSKTALHTHGPAYPASLYFWPGIHAHAMFLVRVGGWANCVRVCVSVCVNVRVLVRVRVRVLVVLCVGGPPDGSLLLVLCRWRRLALAPCSLQQPRAGLAEAGPWNSCDRNQ